MAGIALIGILIMFFVVFPSISKEQQPWCENLSPTVHSIEPIYSTQDGTAVEGSFFLGTGYIDTYMTYLFYTGDDIGGFQRQMIRADNVYIFRDSDAPYMKKETRWITTPISGVSVCTPTDIVELHIPKNTLIKDIVVM